MVEWDEEENEKGLQSLACSTLRIHDGWGYPLTYSHDGWGFWLEASVESSVYDPFEGPRTPLRYTVGEKKLLFSLFKFSLDQRDLKPPTGHGNIPFECLNLNGNGHKTCRKSVKKYISSVCAAGKPSSRGLREEKVLDSEQVEQSVVAALVREESGYFSEDFEDEGMDESLDLCP